MVKKMSNYEVIISQGFGKEKRKLRATSPKDAKDGVRSSFRKRITIFSAKKL